MNKQTALNQSADVQLGLGCIARRARRHIARTRQQSQLSRCQQRRAQSLHRFLGLYGKCHIRSYNMSRIANFVTAAHLGIIEPSSQTTLRRQVTMQQRPCARFLYFGNLRYISYPLNLHPTSTGRALTVQALHQHNIPTVGTRRCGHGVEVDRRPGPFVLSPFFSIPLLLFCVFRQSFSPCPGRLFCVPEWLPVYPNLSRPYISFPCLIIKSD